jgi:hypothetical protein
METEMRHLTLKTCIAGACALGFVAFGVPAMAADQEDLALERDLRPDEEPIVLEDEGVKPKEAMPAESSGGSDANIEDEMIDKIGPGAE